MKLKRVARNGFSTKGRWWSEDGLWIIRLDHAGKKWRVSTGNWEEPSEYEGWWARRKLLKTSGLFEARFKTRREAVAALELMVGLPAETEVIS